MRTIALFLLAASLPAAAFGATQASLTSACMQFWKDSLNAAQYAQVETRMQKMCACQSKATMEAGLKADEVDQLEKFMKGDKAMASTMSKAGEVFNQHAEACDRAAMQ